MTCEACERGRDNATALLDEISKDTALRVRVEIDATTQTLLFRQYETGSYQTVRRVNNSLSDVKRCTRAEACALLTQLADADAIETEHGPVAAIWPDDAGGGGR